MADKRWTAEQKQAIEARGGTLLVSAAAGSGKTAVLVERVIGLITGEEPVDADRLLVVTFTNSAAAEMKERVMLRLGELLAQDPSDVNLQRQQILMQNASISTIHSFCLNLIRDNFETLDIPPDFRIADENEVKVLRAEVLSELLEEKYASELNDGGGDFLTLADILGSGRDDSVLEETILRLHDFIVTLPDPESWLDSKRRMYDPDAAVGDTLWGRAALEYISASLDGFEEKERTALAVIQNYEQLEKYYAPSFESDMASIKLARADADEGKWDALYNRIRNFDFMKLGSPRKFEPAQVKEWAKAQRADVKDAIAKLGKGVLCCDSKGFKEDMLSIYPLAGCLFDAVMELDKRFYKKKLEKGVLDFSDLERLSLKLLTVNNEGKLSPSAAAASVSGRFDEVLVDEYQDTNPTQDEIFHAVSDSGRKLFMVGDVKQSIYRFRRATPELFIDKQERFTAYDGETYPAKIILGRNFRSRSGVTDSINFVFRQLMSKRFGEMDYGHDEELIAGAEYPLREGVDFALHIVDSSDSDDADTREALEARHIAAIITQLIDEKFTVNGENGPRPVRWRDFLILLRSTSSRAEKYKRELTQAGIPVYADVPGGYLDSYEVAVMLSLLRIIDNPLEDVPLLSVMLSPVFGFTPDDLAKIKIQNRRGSLYLALISYAEKNGGRFASFFALLEKLRTYAAVLPADTLILRIFTETGFLNVCEAMPAGEARRANLRLLLDYARSYEAAGYKGLAGFLRFIDRVSEQRGDLAAASTVSESADVVRIMSIHKSKGLEAPICFLAGCGIRFNREDLMRPAMFHPVYGFGTILRDTRLNCKFTTLPREVVKLETEKSSLSEEMRVMYVAMTRARERLYCVMTLADPQSAAKKAAGFLRKDDVRLDPLAASQASGMYEWLLACALRHPDCGKLRKLSGAEEIETLRCASKWEVSISEPQKGEAEATEYSVSEEAAPDPAIAAELERRLAFSYPYGNMSRVPTKLAVSQIAEKDTAKEYSFTDKRPAFLVSAALTPSEKGTALHLFMQYAHLTPDTDAEAVNSEIERLVNSRFLRPEEGEAVDTEKVTAYTRSEIFSEICAASQVWRELRFNIEIPAGEAAPGAFPEGITDDTGETVVLQGMADIVFTRGDGVVILDYKTDHASGEELRHRYSEQLSLYARAVTQVLGQAVKAKYIYGFQSRELIEL